ncbi:MAG: methylated-DNA--[protein]-cysteine S-methyltransferase [Myxococcales bacterium]|nr:methylated-DNA--[protein]-cysteine S-methyltransferase [Myxococcales bacterium]
MLAEARPDALVRLEFARGPASSTRRGGRAPAEAQRLLTRLRRELGEYFSGRRRTFTIPLALEGTAFQVRVWKALLRIPYGKTRSYAELARSVGTPRACRAAGNANGRNRIAILVPCHRVIQADGSLGGYGAGPSRKRFLLRLERDTASKK